MSIIFQAIDWIVSDYNYIDEDNNNDIKYLIKIFGRTNTGHSISVNINDYTPYFYLKGIDNISENLHNSILLRLKEYLNDKMPYHLQNSVIKCKIVRKKDLWGFTNNKAFKFILISFNNVQSMKIAIRMLSKPITLSNLIIRKKFILYENNIEPYLRFIHKQNLEVSGWIELNDYIKSFHNDIKNGDNYQVSWKNVKPYNNNNIAPFKIASFDIECTSFDGSFPTASKTYNKVVYQLLEYNNELKDKIYTKEEKFTLIYDYIFNIFKENKLDFKENFDIDEVKLIINRYIEDIISIINGKLYYEEEDIIRRKKTLLGYFDIEDNFEEDENVSLNEIIEKLTTKFNQLFPKLNGDPIIQIGTTTHLYGNKDCDNKIIVTLGTCAEIDGITVIECKTEKELIIKWVDIINQLDPDIITGYNIIGFDFDYIYHRALEINCVEYLCNLGKLKEPLKECNYDDKYCNCHWVKKTLSSSALGDNYLKYINMEGRVIIDLMKQVQKDHNLDTYKLDFVAQHFINGKIKKKDFNKELNKYYLHVDNPTGIQNGITIRINNNKYLVENIDYNTNIVTIDGNCGNIEGNKWGLSKDDVSPQEIFKCQKGTNKDRAKVAKYCIQDCALCNYLIIKLEIVANNIGMSNVCSIPFSYIFLRGQGVKIFSLVAKQCKEDNFLIPYQDKKWKCEVCNFINNSFSEFCVKNINNEECGSSKPENEGYEGAIVLHPTPGIYVDAPISVLDYASLYPSSMISENISHDTIILNEKYNNLPGYEYVNVTFDLYKGKGDNKQKIGEQTCRYVQFKNEEKGLLPRILQKLLKQRKATRKKITWKTIKFIDIDNNEITRMGNIIEDNNNIIKLKVEDRDIIEIQKLEIISNYDTHNEFQKAVLDGLQLAYKITANSLYGQVGAPTSPIYMKELAASTTAVGRNLIMSAKKFAEDKYNCEVVYGDSVVGYSPVVVKYNNEIYFEKIEEISIKFGRDKWIPCKEEGKQDKEACELNNVYSWTSKGWTKIHRIIRHQLVSHKKIIRVLTHTGCIDVTDDHSLLYKDGTRVSPKDLKIGDELLHKDLDFKYNQLQEKEVEETFSVDEARTFAMFFGDGSSKYYNYKSHLLPSHSYKCTESYINKYRRLFYNNKIKFIPNNIFKSSMIVKKAFLQGIYDSIGVTELYKGKFIIKQIYQKSMISAMSLYYLCVSLGYNVSINTSKDKPSIFIIKYTKNKFIKNPNVINKMFEIDYEGYVYDFTTDNHQFQSGIGNTIISNTDSVFIKLPKLKDYSQYGHPTEKQNILQYNVTVGEKLSADFQKLLKPPHCLEWEKMFYPFIIFSKKRYVGNLYEHDVNKFKQKSMGIVLKRRDNANIVKIIYGGLINIILNEEGIEKSLEFLHSSLDKLSNGKYPIEELVVTKTLRGMYKNPKQIAHKVLADRMKKRDPGSAPQANDRVPYMYIQVKDKKKVKLLQGDKIEDPKYAIENKLTPDYGHYISNQLMKPCLQLYSMILEQLKEYKHKNDNNFWKNKEKFLMEEKKDKKKVNDKIKQLREKEVEEILFSRYLTKIENKKNGIQDVRDYFTIS
jgi:DNA polymerase elongation subunit (family B)